MNYNSAFFLCALPIIFTLYYLITPMVSSEMRTKTGNTLLLIVSYVVLAYENALTQVLHSQLVFLAISASYNL